MNSKKKTFFAITVKLLFTFTSLHAQNLNVAAKPDSIHFFPGYKTISLSPQPVLPNQLPGNFYTTQLPFFCNKELQVQKATGIPIKFRLSTVEYCDKLEGKNR